MKFTSQIIIKNTYKCIVHNVLVHHHATCICLTESINMMVPKTKPVFFFVVVAVFVNIQKWRRNSLETRFAL